MGGVGIRGKHDWNKQKIFGISQKKGGCGFYAGVHSDYFLTFGYVGVWRNTGGIRVLYKNGKRALSMNFYMGDSVFLA